MRQYEAFLTNNGNIAVVVKEDIQDKVIYNAFITPTGQWLREATRNEVANIEANAGLEVIDYTQKQDWFDTNLPQNAPIWEFMGSIRIEEDYSSYKSETCCNGGDYAFYTSLDVYFTTINGKPIIRGVTRYSTSAEFSYDELNGSFQSNLTTCEVLNTNYQYIIGDEVFSRVAIYSTQGYDTTYLEQISQIYKLEDIGTMTCKIIERDDEGEIVESEVTSRDAMETATKLYELGCELTTSRNQRRG